MSIQISQFILPPTLPPVTINLFSTSVTLCFVNLFICTILFLDSTYKWHRILSFCVWLTLASMTVSRSVSVATNGRISFFYILLILPLWSLFLSLAIPQFGLLSQVSSLRWSSGHSGLVLTLRTHDAACASLSSRCSLVVDMSLWVTSLLAVAVRRIFCGLSLLFFFSPGYVALWDSKTPHRPICERVSYCLETSPPSQLPPQDGPPSITLLSFIFCPTSFRREWADFLGAWCPLPAFRSCFVEVAQHSNDLLMNLWGRKWSPCLILHHLLYIGFYTTKLTSFQL